MTAPIPPEPPKPLPDLDEAVGLLYLKLDGRAKARLLTRPAGTRWRGGLKSGRVGSRQGPYPDIVSVYDLDEQLDRAGDLFDADMMLAVIEGERA